MVIPLRTRKVLDLLAKNPEVKVVDLITEQELTANYSVKVTVETHWSTQPKNEMESIVREMIVEKNDADDLVSLSEKYIKKAIVARTNYRIEDAISFSNLIQGLKGALSKHKGSKS